MSEMYTMIDDHLAWNVSNSDLTELTRPGSSGTMFIDFNPYGEMEVSYRNGVNKKLPTPPVPSKTSIPSKVPVPSTPTLTHNEIQVEIQPPKVQRKEVKQAKPLPSRPSHGSRHDSVISSGAEHSENINPFRARPLPRLPSQEYQTRPLPRIPSQAPQYPHVQRRKTRKSYPPQVHCTQRSSTPVHPSPIPSEASDAASYHTAAPFHDTIPIEVIEPSGITVHYHAANCQAYVSGQDADKNYNWEYDGRVVHVRGSPTPSRPTSYTSEYFNIPASFYSHSTPLLSSTSPSFSEPQVAQDKLQVRHESKPLPPLPGTLPEPPHQDVKKRRKTLAFVQKLLHKLDNMGVMEELSHHRYHRRSASRAEKLEEKSWVKHGYVT